MTGNTILRNVIFTSILVCLASGAGLAQTSTFTYQGKLTDGGTAANGQYDFVFRLFDAPAGGMQVGADVTVGDVQATGGVFTVNLNFGTSPFASGADRHLEISVRPGASTGGYTPLAPLQPLTSSPYSIKTLSATSADSLSAACVSCVTDASIDTVGANKITGVLSYFQGGTGFGGTFLPAGVFLRSNGAGWQANGILASDIPTNLGSYIQNTTTAQTSSNFNISGNGTAGGILSGNVVNSATQFNIGGSRVLSIAGINNLFAGINAGTSNASGNVNAFFGTMAGQQNSSGSENAFFGFAAGFSNQGGCCNSFFGRSSGQQNILGQLNSFFGVASGFTNINGTNNTIIGAGADVASSTLFFATAIGSGSVVSSDNTVVLGRSLDTVRIPGALNVTGATTFGGTLGANIVNATTQYNIGGNRILSGAGTNLIVGIDAGPLNTGFNNSFFGRQAGQFNMTSSDNSFFGTFAGRGNTGDFNSFFGARAGELNQTGQRNSFFGNRAGVLTNASANSFFGENAGSANTSGASNVFFGVNAGDTNTTGNNNTVIGTDADVSTNNLTNATAIGSGAIVSQSNSLVLGGAANVGIGTTAPKTKLHVAGGNIYIANPGNLIMSSPNGSCWALSVDNTGVLSAASVACP